MFSNLLIKNIQFITCTILKMVYYHIMVKQLKNQKKYFIMKSLKKISQNITQEMLYMKEMVKVHHFQRKKYIMVILSEIKDQVKVNVIIILIKNFTKVSGLIIKEVVKVYNIIVIIILSTMVNGNQTYFMERVGM